MDSDKSPFLRKGKALCFIDNLLVVGSLSHQSFMCSVFVTLCVFFLVLTGVAGDWKNHFSPEQLAKFTSALSKELEGEEKALKYLV